MKVLNEVGVVSVDQMSVGVVSPSTTFKTGVMCLTMDLIKSFREVSHVYQSSFIERFWHFV